MAYTTVAKGNAFRDHIADLFRSAGFEVEIEVRIKFKKVDIIATRNGFDGQTRYAIETKDYSGNVPKGECIEFCAEYSSLVNDREVDRAWIIASDDFSPDAKGLVSSKPGLDAVPYETFLRRLIGIERYLNQIVKDYNDSQLSNYYIRPRSTDLNEDLEAVVRKWIDEEGAQPLAIVSGYGRGKSTFARYLSHSLAVDAIGNFTARAPILVTLGNIVDEQSLEGLLGKTFTATASSQNYNFELFMKLNEAGKFVVIFDGFDEMKHGMTIGKFENNIKELMRLDRGKAKVIILGRDTAFHDDIEFRSIIDGVQVTHGGQEVSISGRRPFKQLGVREFSIEESRQFVEKFFPLAAKEADRSAKNDWITARANELLSGEFDDLLERPVHAQMLCQVASDKSLDLKGLTKHGLFDRFVHFLIEREVNKKGRDARFGLAVRRRFNAAVAAWLWQEGGASSVTLLSVPPEICNSAVKGVDHGMDDHALRRELVAGCLIEKSGSTAYFGHRSLQEFLVAEAILAEYAEAFPLDSLDKFKAVMYCTSPEINDYIIGAISFSSANRAAAERLLKGAEHFQFRDLPGSGLSLLFRIAASRKTRVDEMPSSSWSLWFRLFHANGSVDVSNLSKQAISELQSIFSLKVVGDPLAIDEYLCTALTLLAYLLANGEADKLLPICPHLVSNWLVPSEIEENVRLARKTSRNEHVYVKDYQQMRLWSFLKTTSFEKMSGGNGIRIYISSILKELAVFCSCGSPTDWYIPTSRQVGLGITGVVDVYPQQIYRFWTSLGSTELDHIRPFFSNQEIQQKIKPLEVEVKRTRRTLRITPPPQSSKPRLSLPGSSKPDG